MANILAGHLEMTFQPNDEEEHHNWIEPITENIIPYSPTSPDEINNILPKKALILTQLIGKF